MSRPSLSSGSIDKARKLAKEADEAARSGFFKKPDWDKASSLYEQSAKEFRLAGPPYIDSYVDCLRKAAGAFDKTGSAYKAAMLLEEASTALSKSDSSGKNAAPLFQEAALKYRQAEHPDKSAACLQKAGMALGNAGDIDGAMQMFSSAVAVFEDEGRGHMSNDTFKQIIGWCCRQGRIDDAIQFLKRQREVFKKQGDKLDPYVYKNSLAILVCYIHLDRYDEAEEEYKQSLDYKQFGMTDEGEAASELLEAVRMASNDMLQACVKKPAFSYLDNEVARIAQRLRLDEDKVRNRPLKAPEEDHSLDLLK